MGGDNKGPGGDNNDMGGDNKGTSGDINDTNNSNNYVPRMDSLT